MKLITRIEGKILEMLRNPGLAKCFSDFAYEFFDTEWFRNEPACPGNIRGKFCREFPFNSNHDNGNTFRFLMRCDGTADFNAIHFRELDIEQDEVGFILMGAFDAFFTGADGYGFISGLRKNGADKLVHVLIVFYHENRLIFV